MHFFRKLQKDVANSEESALLLREDDTAYSEEKAKTKKEACNIADTLCKKATAYFLENEERDLAKKVHLTYLHFYRCNDFIAEERLKEIHKLLHSKIDWFPIEVLCEDELDILKSKIKEFTSTLGSSAVNDKPSPDLLSNLRENLKLVDVDIRYIGNYLEEYKKTNKDFYDGFSELNVLPVQKVENEITRVEIAITDSYSDMPLPDVKCTLSKSEKILFTDKTGKVVFIGPKAGRCIAIFVLEGYRDYITNIRINANKENRVSISMESFVT